MKTKILLLTALIGVAAMSANAGVRFSFSLGLPVPVVVSPPVVAAPVVYSAPVAPAPVAVVQTVPPCPGPDYVWVAGYWSYLPTGRVWMAGAWQYRPARVAYVNIRHDADGRYAAHYRDDRHDWDNNRGRDGHHR